MWKFAPMFAKIRYWGRTAAVSRKTFYAFGGEFQLIPGRRRLWYCIHRPPAGRRTRSTFVLQLKRNYGFFGMARSSRLLWRRSALLWRVGFLFLPCLDCAIFTIFSILGCEEASWDKGVEYETRSLLFKALHSLIERSLLQRDYVRLGQWFVQPLCLDEVSNPPK